MFRQVAISEFYRLVQLHVSDTDPASVSMSELTYIYTTMASLRSVADVQQHGCSVLLALCGPYSGNAVKLLIASGGQDAIIAALTAHTRNAEVQRFGLMALFTMIDISGEDRSFRRLLLSHGLVKVVLSAMECHVSTSSVLESACSMLMTLCIGCSPPLAEAIDEVVAAGGLEQIMAAMHAHVPDGAVQLAGLMALNSLSDSGPNKDGIKLRLVALGGVTHMLAAMSAHKKNVSVQEWALRSLTNLTGLGVPTGLSGRLMNNPAALSRAQEIHDANPSYMIRFQAGGRTLACVRAAQAAFRSHTKIQEYAKCLLPVLIAGDAQNTDK